MMTYGDIMIPRGNIWLVEINIRGAVVIYGTLGVRQYYYYTKEEAIELYNEEARKTFFEEARYAT